MARIVDYYKVYVDFKGEEDVAVLIDSDTSVHCESKPIWEDLSKSWILNHNDGMISYLRADALKSIAWIVEYKKPVI